MADDRLVPKSAGKMMGALALIGALAGAGTLLVWGCTDNSLSCDCGAGDKPSQARIGCAAP